jgi:O-acetyl-ADP-ribose deacetylase (regulator of RNase III)
MTLKQRMTTGTISKKRKSMITYTSGDLFESKCQTLVNATNTEGIMGGGIALEFKKRYPKMFTAYEFACDNNWHTVHRPFFWWPPIDEIGINVLNIATKDKIREPSTLSNIGAGLGRLVEYYKRIRITSIALPALGCGLGRCDWRQVQPIMHGYLQLLDIPVVVYVPQG